MENPSLTCDIWEYICGLLSNKDKCRLLRCNKNLVTFCKPLFTEPIFISKITKSQWFDNYTNIILHERLINDIKFPINMNCLNISQGDNINGEYIPNTVTHLIISNCDIF